MRRNKGMLLAEFSQRNEVMQTQFQKEGVVCKVENPVTGEFVDMTYDEIKELERKEGVEFIMVGTVPIIPISTQQLSKIEQEMKNNIHRLEPTIYPRGMSRFLRH